MESIRDIKAMREVLEMDDEDTTLLSAGEAARRTRRDTGSSVSA
jgi:hypothetical protein